LWLEATVDAEDVSRNVAVKIMLEKYANISVLKNKILERLANISYTA
jgi:hypothetical protein